MSSKKRGRLKENAVLVFKPKKNVPFTPLNEVERKEEKRLEDTEMFEKVYNLECAAPTVYIKMK